MIAISCTSCEKKLRLQDTFAGKRIKCPGCGTILSVPGGIAAKPPAPPKAAPQEDEDERPRRRAEVDEDEDEETPKSRKRSKSESDATGKPSILFLVLGLALGLGGLLAMCACIYFAKVANDRIADLKFDLKKLKDDYEFIDGQFKGRMAGVVLAGEDKKVEETKRLFDEKDLELSRESGSITRNYILAGVCGVVLLAGIVLRGYHHIAMHRWQANHPEKPKKKRKKRKRVEEEVDDDE